MTTLAQLTNTHLGGGDEYDLEQFKLAVLRYMEENGLEIGDDEAEAQGIDAIWGDGDFVPRVRRYVPDYEAHGND